MWFAVLHESNDTKQVFILQADHSLKPGNNISATHFFLGAIYLKQNKVKSGKINENLNK